MQHLNKCKTIIIEDKTLWILFLGCCLVLFVNAPQLLNKAHTNKRHGSVFHGRSLRPEGCQSHGVVRRQFAHPGVECETHVSVWVGVRRIEQRRVSVSQYENALSVHLREHLIRPAHQQTFFFLFFFPQPLFSPSPSRYL